MREAAVAVVAGALLVFLLLRRAFRAAPISKESAGVVRGTATSLAIHPIKSCGRIEVPTILFDEVGPVNDRRYMIVSSDDGSFVTQRQVPKLAHVQVKIESDDVYMKIPTSPDQWLCISDLRSSSQRRVRVWNDWMDADDLGDLVAKALSEYCDRSVRLVRVSCDHQRVRPDGSVNSASFCDTAQVLVVSRTSMDALNKAMKAELSIDRFRANVIVDGFLPFAEDTWARIKIGNTVLMGGKARTRCLVTTIDPVTLERGEEPIKTLASFHSNTAGKTCFGTLFYAETTGKICAGDEVEVLEFKQNPAVLLD